MKELGTILGDLHGDESGASFIEYSVLIGVVLVASIVTIAAVGTWASGQWTALNTAVNP